MDLASALTTITALGELTKNVVGGKIDAEVKEKASELADSIIGLQNIIFTIQSKNHELLDENRELKEKIEKMDRWAQTSSKYELYEICSGVHLYSLKKGATNEPEHYVCPNCFENRNKSILVKKSKDSTGTSYSCVAKDCGANYNDYENRTKFAPISRRTTGLY